MAWGGVNPFCQGFVKTQPINGPPEFRGGNRAGRTLFPSQPDCTRGPPPTTPPVVPRLCWPDGPPPTHRWEVRIHQPFSSRFQSAGVGGAPFLLDELDFLSPVFFGHDVPHPEPKRARVPPAL